MKKTIFILTLVIATVLMPFKTPRSVAQADIEAPTLNENTYPKTINAGDHF